MCTGHFEGPFSSGQPAADSGRQRPVARRPLPAARCPHISPLAAPILMMAMAMLFGGLVLAEQPPREPPGAEEMLQRLLRSPGEAAEPIQPAGQVPLPHPAGGAAAVSPAAVPPALLREGTYIVDRVGRLSRDGDDGQMAITFDADGQALEDPPMLILPNLRLMEMENRVRASQRDLRFRVTGMVTEYRGRNHILLEKAVVVPENP